MSTTNMHAVAIKEFTAVLFWPVLGWFLYFGLLLLGERRIAREFSFLHPLWLTPVVVPVVLLLWKCRQYRYSFWGAMLSGTVFSCGILTCLVTAISWGGMPTNGSSFGETTVASLVLTVLPSAFLGLLMAILYWLSTKLRPFKGHKTNP
jgi:hypothetical protein